MNYESYALLAFWSGEEAEELLDFYEDHTVDETVDHILQLGDGAETRRSKQPFYGTSDDVGRRGDHFL